MGELIAINIISAQMNISSRTLRYWEEMGLFKSERSQSGWRMYDKETLACIRIIELLRSFDLSISEIKKILEHKSVDELLKALKRQLKRLEKINGDLEKRYAVISEILEVIQSNQIVSLPGIENILTPVVLKRTNKKINKNNIKEITDMPIFDIKYEHEYIISALPPMRTAACHHYGTEPENPDPALTWIKENNLLGTARFFGFNTEALPADKGPGFGYDFCASIPEETSIPDYLYEKRLPGGLYAAFSNHGIGMGKLWDKINKGFENDECEWERDSGRLCLEEHEGGVFGTVDSPLSITVLIPVKKRV